MSAIVLIATRSAGKLRELAPLLAGLGLEARTLDAVGLAETPDEAAIEAFDTFEENAIAKARHFHAMSGLPTVADDDWPSRATIFWRSAAGSPAALCRRDPTIRGSSELN